MTRNRDAELAAQPSSHDSNRPRTWQRNSDSWDMDGVSLDPDGRSWDLAGRSWDPGYRLWDLDCQLWDTIAVDSVANTRLTFDNG